MIRTNWTPLTCLPQTKKLAVGSSVSSLSGLYTTVMKAAGASRRVFQLLDRTSSMPKAGEKCPIGSVDEVQAVGFLPTFILVFSFI